MKRTTIFIMAMTISLLMLANANAQITVAVTDPGEVIVIDPALTGADNLEFKPSPQVKMSVYSNVNGFSTNGVHGAALGTVGGQAFGMASDTTKVYWVSVAAEGSVLTGVTTASSAEFEVTQTTYNPMQ
ncbi:MAG: hypothetical protein SCH71_13205 [Desulfobulbaceae bacterium]|nr:hypothetical protein [Desulfobulbaceae bacterium]